MCAQENNTPKKHTTIHVLKYHIATTYPEHTYKATAHIRKGDEIFMPFRRFTFTQPPPKQRSPRSHNTTQQKQKQQQYAAHPAHAHASSPHPPEHSSSEWVRWRINNVDWKLFESVIFPSIQALQCERVSPHQS